MKKVKGKKKSLVGYIYKCEFREILYWEDGEWMKISEDFAPFKHKRIENESDRLCGEHQEHGMQKVRITIEELP